MAVVVFLATGFEEIEAMGIVDTLRRAGIEVVIAGLQTGAIEGGHGVKVVPDRQIEGINIEDFEVVPDRQIEGINIEDFDVVVLPGGSPGYVNLGNDKRVLDAVRKAFERGKVVAAICGAPSVLAKAGILEGKKATIYPGLETALAGAKHINERVVEDGKIITSQGPGTALEFGVKLVEILAGEKSARELKDSLVANF